MNTIVKISKMKISPLAKIRKFMDKETDLQLKNKNNIFILYREMLSPSTKGTITLREHLFKVQDYLSQFIAEGIADGSLRKDLNPRRTAFALESILAFFFMAKDNIKVAFGFEEDTMKEHVEGIYTDYINSLLVKEDNHHADAKI